MSIAKFIYNFNLLLQNNLLRQEKFVSNFRRWNHILLSVKPKRIYIKFSKAKLQQRENFVLKC